MDIFRLFQKYFSSQPVRERQQSDSKPVDSLTKKKRLVLLDKSFMAGVPTVQLNELRGSYAFVACETLYGECLAHFVSGSSKSDIGKNYTLNGLLKFSKEGEYLLRFPNINMLINQEVSSRRPCWPIEDYIQKEILFNRERFINDCSLSEAEEASILNWKKFVSESAYGVVQCCEQSKWLPLEYDDELRALHSLDPIPVAEITRVLLRRLPQLYDQIGRDEGLVRAQYTRFKSFDYPPAAKLSRDWLLFRHMQALLLIHLELIEIALKTRRPFNMEDVFHHWNDYQYCVAGSQLKGVATADKKFAERFRCLCPTGVLLYFRQKDKEVISIPPCADLRAYL